MMYKLSILLTIVLLMQIVFLGPYVHAGGSFDDTEKDLVLVDRYYRKKEYRKAESVLNEVIKETGIDDGNRDYAMGYSESIRSSIKYWQNVFKDRKGYFRDFPRLTGVVVEHFGNMAGYFKIRKGKEIISFTYERDLLVVGGEITKGMKVTVYYVPGSEEMKTALKVVVHRT